MTATSNQGTSDALIEVSDIWKIFGDNAGFVLDQIKECKVEVLAVDFVGEVHHTELIF